MPTHLRYGCIFTDVANPFAKNQREGWQHKPIRKLYCPDFTCYKLHITEIMIHDTELNGCFCNPLSHMHGLCIRFSALQISRQWMNDLYVEKIYSHFRFSKPRHYQSKSKRFLPSTGNIFASTFDGGFFNISWQIQVGMNGILLPKLFYCEKKMF